MEFASSFLCCFAAERHDCGVHLLVKNCVLWWEPECILCLTRINFDGRFDVRDALLLVLHQKRDFSTQRQRSGGPRIHFHRMC